MSVVAIDFGKALKEDVISFHIPRMTADEFYEFCQRNPDLNVERNARGDIELMAPADSYADSLNVTITTDLEIWNRTLAEPGMVFGPSTAFTLPSGAQRGPDAAWIPIARWNALTDEERDGFAHICPDFIVELMSPSDRIGKAKEKMDEWMENGVRLGVLIHRKRRRVFVYRPGQKTEELSEPTAVSCEPELPGFTLRTARIFG